VLINQERCTRCAQCISFCPVGAIVGDKATKQIVVDQERCVECNVCYRSGVCPEDAFVLPTLTWPRSVRGVFSDPVQVHKETRIPGRGTEEMKTNDVTGRFKRGQVGIAIELGRPGTSTSFRDVQKVAEVCARHGVTFEPQNPVTFLMVDRARGLLNPEVLDERVLSAIIEFEVDQAKVPALLRDLRAVSQEIQTVFSLNACQLVEPDGSVPMLKMLRAEGFQPSPNGKNNVGLGKPAYPFFGEEA
jgi:NAD-dependent dihydropyrimidine dehydrogenase PreA subunit